MHIMQTEVSETSAACQGHIQKVSTLKAMQTLFCECREVKLTVFILLMCV